jgi:hypothetical protein
LLHYIHLRSIFLSVYLNIAKIKQTLCLYVIVANIFMNMCKFLRAVSFSKNVSLYFTENSDFIRYEDRLAYGGNNS